MAEEKLTFRIEFPESTPPAERDRLLAAVRLHGATAVPVETREPVTVILITLKLVGAAASAAAACMKLAREIKKWRKDARAKGNTPPATLKRDDKDELNLDKASDEEIEKWLQP